jgi:hypothetical protein
VGVGVGGRGWTGGGGARECEWTGQEGVKRGRGAGGGNVNGQCRRALTGGGMGMGVGARGTKGSGGIGGNNPWPQRAECCPTSRENTPASAPCPRFLHSPTHIHTHPPPHTHPHPSSQGASTPQGHGLASHQFAGSGGSGGGGCAVHAGAKQGVRGLAVAGPDTRRVAAVRARHDAHQGPQVAREPAARGGIHQEHTGVREW